MSAQSNFRSTPQRTLELLDGNLVTNVTAYAGALCVRDTATGYDKPGVTGTGLIARGVFTKTVSSVGFSSGVKKVPVQPGCFRFNNSADADAIAAADRGLPCYIVDDQTVAKTNGGATRSIAGTIEDVDSSGVYVNIGSVNGTSVASLAAAVQALPGNVTNGSPGMLVVIPIAVADGVTGNVDTVVAAKTEIIAINFLKNASAGGAGDTLQAANGATTDYITDAMSLNVAANVTVRNSTILSANSTLAAGATLRLIRTKASAANVGGTAIVYGIRRA